MFDLPNSKRYKIDVQHVRYLCKANESRVRRNELDSPSSSRASSPDIDLLEKLRASTQFDLIETTVQPIQNNTVAGAEEDKDPDEELAFNLFAPTTKSTSSENATPAAPQTIRLRSPTPPEAQDAGFVVAQRDKSYFFTGPVTAAKKAEYDAVAVTGATVAAWSKLPCPGCAYAWKTISIPASAAKKTLALDATVAEEKFLPDEERERKRKRKGKKARIKIRVKAEKARAKKEMLEKGKEEKERAVREKNARRNREKKLKKRAKDKAKKAASKTGDAQDDADGSHGESAEDSE
ncbi:hypothetical protein BDV97DRAFT_410114 [Delphinella strobiligena]|nr:hypothetical protein BDV97DRAFT_410114 [Delphinella strobiligena]